MNPGSYGFGSGIIPSAFASASLISCNCLTLTPVTSSVMRDAHRGMKIDGRHILKAGRLRTPSACSPHVFPFLASQIVAGHMESIVACFKPGVKITVLVRTPGAPDCDFMMTDDTTEELMAMIERRQKAESK